MNQFGYGGMISKIEMCSTRYGSMFLSVSTYLVQTSCSIWIHSFAGIACWKLGEVKLVPLIVQGSLWYRRHEWPCFLCVSKESFQLCSSTFTMIRSSCAFENISTDFLETKNGRHWKRTWTVWAENSSFLCSLHFYFSLHELLFG